MDTNKLIPLLSEMAVFVQVVESGSFSAAATKLGVAPSSISRSISRLEGALEEKLLERTTRQMRLSATGQQVFNLCRDMLSSAKLAVSAAQVDKSTISGSLRVAAPKAWSRQVLMPHILDFSVAYPQVELQLKVADHYIDPIGDEVDIIIHITESPVAGLIAKPLGSCKLVLCANSSYLAQHGKLTHPSELTEHNCIRLGEDPKDCIWEFLQHEEKQSIGIRGSFAVNHSELRREAMLRGMGITVLPEFAIRDYIESGEAVELLPEWRLLGRYQGQVVAQYAQSKYIPSQIKVFIEFLQNRLVDLAPS